ncbi:MAG TPA: Hsp20/alpha crystallin family protein [Phnomibacter sp.]|nr:Hsp20/alpha crystallin family protein [Phnomibacter sp.]
MTLVKVNNRPALKTWNGLVNELFNDLEQSFAPLAPAANRNWPAVNIIENADGYHAELLAPGRNKANFSIAIENDQLVVAYDAEKTETPADWKQVRKEFTLGNFRRTFALDGSVDANGIQAKYEDGILKIFLPKKPELKPATRTIEIQ